jgi:hypothetical protein
MLPTRFLIRRVKRPRTPRERDELLAIQLDTRTARDPTVVVYSITHGAWRTEHHRRLMQRTKRATPEESATARQELEAIGETAVRVLQAAPRAPHIHDDD